MRGKIHVFTWFNAKRLINKKQIKQNKINKIKLSKNEMKNVLLNEIK